LVSLPLNSFEPAKPDSALHSWFRCHSTRLNRQSRILHCTVGFGSGAWMQTPDSTGKRKNSETIGGCEA
jgi:hypothetical protein